jgi:hypothetical protein
VLKAIGVTYCVEIEVMVLTDTELVVVVAVGLGTRHPQTEEIAVLAEDDRAELHSAFWLAELGTDDVVLALAVLGVVAVVARLCFTGGGPDVIVVVIMEVAVCKWYRKISEGEKLHNQWLTNSRIGLGRARGSNDFRSCSCGGLGCRRGIWSDSRIVSLLEAGCDQCSYVVDSVEVIIVIKAGNVNLCPFQRSPDTIVPAHIRCRSRFGDHLCSGGSRHTVQCYC